MKKLMSPRERAVTALNCKIPDMVPAFEITFQLEKEYMGKNFLTTKDLINLSSSEIDYKLHENAEYLIAFYEKLEHSIIPIQSLEFEHILETARIIRKMTGDRFMLITHGDGTFSIPDGTRMYEFAYSIADDPEGLLEQAERSANAAIERNKRAVEAGFDSFKLCSDYCYNSGPFISPQMFSKFITPFLKKIITGIRQSGAFAIKHSDGNIMPILDQLVECEPHALHSLDPQAGVDIKEVKRLIGDRICLCGNVNCGLMQTGTDEEVIENAEYSIAHGKPGGGYMFCLSNAVFRGMPLERYLLMQSVWKKHRMYN